MRAARRMGAQPSPQRPGRDTCRLELRPDLECLDLLYLAGATTAGRLSAHTGLTSVPRRPPIDRLEHAGFVTRRRDARDRRVVLVEVVETGAKLIHPFYRPLAERMDKVNARYPHPAGDRVAVSHRRDRGHRGARGVAADAARPVQTPLPTSDDGGSGPSGALLSTQLAQVARRTSRRATSRARS